jgi:hypothetical protein
MNIHVAVDVPGLTNGLITALRHSPATADAQKLSHTAPFAVPRQSLTDPLCNPSRALLNSNGHRDDHHFQPVNLSSLKASAACLSRRWTVRPASSTGKTPSHDPSRGRKTTEKNSTRSSTTEAAASTGSNATLQAPGSALACSHSALLLCAREREHLTGQTWPATLCPRFVLTAGWPVMASGLTLSHRTPSSSSVRARPVIQPLESVGAP